MTFEEFAEGCPWSALRIEVSPPYCDIPSMVTGSGQMPCTEQCCGLWYLRGTVAAMNIKVGFTDSADGELEAVCNITSSPNSES